MFKQAMAGEMSLCLTSSDRGTKPATAAGPAGSTAAAFGSLPWAVQGSILAELGQAVAGAMAARRRARGVEQTVVALSHLNDHTLQDLGIPRSQIPAVAETAVNEPQADLRTMVG